VFYITVNVTHHGSHKHSIRQTETVHCDERCIVIRVGNCLLINVYLPCVGSADRQLIFNNMLDKICSWREYYTDCQVVAAGDLNVCLDKVNDNVADSTNSLSRDLELIHCDELDIAKRSFYRAANAVFGEIGRSASDDVVLIITHSKCVPILLYGLEN